MLPTTTSIVADFPGVTTTIVVLAASMVVMFALRWLVIYLLASKALDKVGDTDAAKILEAAATLWRRQRK